MFANHEPGGPFTVLHLVTGLERGDGVTEIASTVCCGLDPDRFRPVVCGIRGGGCYAEMLREKGIPVYIYDIGSPLDPLQYLRLLKVIWQIRGLLVRERIAILHAHNLFAGVTGLAASMGLPKVRRVLTMHNPLNYYSDGRTFAYQAVRLRRWLLSSFCGRWDRIAGVSQTVCGYIRRFNPSFARVDRVYNGIRSKRFEMSGGKADLRPQWGIPPGAPVIGTLTGREKIKGELCLLYAAAEVLKHRPDAYFVFIGAKVVFEPETDGQLRRLAEQLGTGGRVLFVDRMKDLAPALSSLDLFVFAPTLAGFGLALAEAMYMGIPVIASDIDVFREIVEDTVSGSLFPVQNPTALAYTILEVLSDRQAATAMAQRGRERVKQAFLAERMVTDYQAFYGRAMAS